MSYLVDTNILLRSSDPHHAMYLDAVTALKKLRQRKETLYITSQNLVEYWNVYTRPQKQNGLGGSIIEVQTEINRLKSLFWVLPDHSTIYQQWEELVSNYQVKGVNVHDARLVAFMLVYSITHILTFNTDDFKRYTEIAVVHPTELKTN
ncbi:PIN domain-containing protein [Microcystis aeruginosa NIES-298]|uniref:PIN domain-containing protein n=2 Tax=Microcystis aeruginosa TaxID=1126 RepID=A0A2H6BMU7_MICAE|nr:type II toxin-antitoxin system VapC family toxin [Microcystis aeruginosa]MDB9508014.1 type II toxin-antitoxin system VapC family toxin [Microcystis aeruginosa CS-338/01]QHU83642.1 PIN domain-containing protein [Microcystis aeruginosa NIES-298]GBD51493.1 hypothetical protein BGM30_05860 [Microcystis aeruginosa NIES-298]GBE98425.1 twitching motility protein PilT [Microcystis aeruginosa NIES-298]